MESQKIKDIEELQKIAKKIRKGIIEEVYSSQSGHPGGSLSIADILTVLYFYEMNINPENPKDENSITIFQENDDVIIGFAIVFPKSNTQHTVEFAINTSLANEYYQSEIDFDDNNDNLEDNE